MLHIKGYRPILKFEILNLAPRARAARALLLGAACRDALHAAQ
jgi:hypothetical protein